MSATKALGGLKAFAGSLDGGVVLTEVLERFMKQPEDDMRMVEIGTLSERLACADAKTIGVLNELEQAGILKITSSVKPAPGCLIMVKSIKLEMHVVQGAINFDETNPAPEAAMAPKAVNRLDRLDGRDETVDGVAWHGEVQPVYKGDTDEVLSCKLTVTKDGAEVVIGQECTGPMPVRTAWLWFENYIQYTITLADWLAENYTTTPMLLDAETFQTVCEQLRDSNPDKPSTLALVETSLKSGSLAVKLGSVKRLYKRDDKGLRWPNLAANAGPVAGTKPKGKKTKEAAAK